MPPTIKITPAGKVIGAMPQSEIDRTPVLLALNVGASDDPVEVKIEVVFHSVRIKRRVVKGFWHIAATEAEIELRAYHARLADLTKSGPVTVKYALTTSTKKEGGIDIKPEIKIGEEVSVDVGSLDLKKEKSEEATIEYSGEEYPLTSAVIGDNVVWSFSETHGPKLIREFILGNLPLTAAYNWKRRPRSGFLAVRTSPRIFDSDGKRVSDAKSLALGFLLFRKSHLANEYGTEVQFEVGEK
jgi:hypothetical protein